MIELHGKYSSAKIFTNSADDEVKQQIQTLLDSEISSGTRIRIMPDVHKGVGSVIGFTQSLPRYITPSIIGVDIGCGVLTVKVPYQVPDCLKQQFFEQLDGYIKTYIPSGFEVNKGPVSKEILQPLFDKLNNKTLSFDEFYDRLLKVGKKVGCSSLSAIGSLGGGNHFIELEESTITRNLYFTVHTGSRALGKKVCDYHMKKTGNTALTDKELEDLYQALAKGEAVAVNKYMRDCFWKFVVKRLKCDFAGQELGEKLEQAKQLTQYVETADRITFLHQQEDIQEYYDDMNVCQIFAQLNRRRILELVIAFVQQFGAEHERGLLPAQPAPQGLPDFIESVHNYIDFQDSIIRKGSIRAYRGEPLIIPLNMRDGVILGYGKSIEDWNFSAPHGAGRRFSRTECKHRFSMEDYVKDMQGVYSTTVNRGTLDECPQAYKESEDIKALIRDSVEIVEHLRAVYNFKAGE